jgi:hypothetical protein
MRDVGENNEDYILDAAIALAGSAAPGSVCEDAEILVLTRAGHQRALKGKSGFVWPRQRQQ